MRTYPHKIDAELLGENRASALDLIGRLGQTQAKAEADRNPVFFQILGEQVKNLGVYSYAYGEPDAQAVGHLRQANAHLAKAVAFGLVMDPYEYIDYLSLAIILTDVEQAKQLAAFPRSRYVNEEVQPGEVIYLLAEIMGMLLLGAKELPERLEAARQALASKKTSRYDRGVAQTLIALAEAVAARDQAAFDQAVAARQQDFKKAHNRADERETPGALLDIPGLALVRLAQARGLRYVTQSAYLPAELLQR